jgi:uncharacterized oligopeptide transporter (OPT) family protein
MSAFIAEPAAPIEPAAAPLAPAEAVKDPELRWLKEVYQPGARQLTFRAVVTGMILGAVMCLSNLYVVLKTGWSLGVTVTACILAFAVFGALKSLRLVKNDFTILENNAMGSVASAAGFMTGGGNMAAVPALLLLTGMRPDPWAMVGWFAVIAALGVFAAIPIKRQLINIEALPFPTGTATAETLRSMHHAKKSDSARFLTWAGVIGAALAWLRDAKAAWMPFNLPAHFGLPFSYAGHAAGTWTLAFEGSLILMGGGALMSFKTGWSLLLGGVLTYGVMAPAMVARGVITSVSYKGIMQYSLWPGAAILVSSGILSFAFQWRSVARSLSGLAQVLSARKADKGDDPVAEVECPAWWFPAGFIVLSPIVIALMAILFGIPWWAGMLAIPLSLMMGVVAARVTGETDVTPTKALGPVTQFIYGALLPANVTANVMSANVTGGVGLHAADLLLDLKSGYLLGASPRQQLYAQLFGVVAGAAVVVPAFNLLVPNAEVLGSEAFPAPSVLVWAGVSKALSHGVSGLHPAARTATAVGVLVGIGLVLIDRWAPKRLKPYVPSPSGLGIAMVMPGFNALSMFLGSLIAEVLRRRNPALAERTVVPVSSGFIAGESLMGIVIAMLVAFGMLGR